MISLVQLEYIVAVDRYRHFVTASQKCFVTQPTLSMQIKKMEVELGVLIFDRTKQPLTPTEIGEKIIDQARITLAQSKKITEVVANYNDTVSGKITIGIIPSLAPYLLPLFIRKFTKKYPEVSVTVIELLTNEIIEGLKKDSIDVGILVTPLHEKGIKEDCLFYEKMLIYINKSHPLALKKEIQSKDLVNSDLWLLSTGHCFRSQVMNLCNYKDNTLKNQDFNYESGSLETIKKLVALEGGFTLIPELAVDGHNNNTIVRDFNDTNPIREVSFAYSHNYFKKKLLDLLSQEIKNAVPQEMLEKNRGQIVEWR